MTFIAAFGIGSIIAAALGWLGIRAVAISWHRQNWINALGDDLVAYFEEVELAHAGASATAEADGQPAGLALAKTRESRHAALRIYRRMLLRLDMTEPNHLQLRRLLEDLLDERGAGSDRQRVDAVVALAGRLLNDEGAKAKYGIFATPVTTGKIWWRRRFGGSRPSRQAPRTRRNPWQT